jgi:hypothetical protein
MPNGRATSAVELPAGGGGDHVADRAAESRFDVTAGQVLGRSVGGAALLFDQVNAVMSAIP